MDFAARCPGILLPPPVVEEDGVYLNKFAKIFDGESPGTSLLTEDDGIPRRLVWVDTEVERTLR